VVAVEAIGVAREQMPLRFGLVGEVRAVVLDRLGGRVRQRKKGKGAGEQGKEGGSNAEAQVHAVDGTYLARSKSTEGST